MENIYRFPKNNLIYIRDIMEKYLEVLQEFPIPKNEENIKSAMNYLGTEEEFKKLKESVSLEIELQSEEDHIPISEFDPDKIERKHEIYNSRSNILSKDLNLETSKELIKFREKLVGRSSIIRHVFGKTELQHKYLRTEFKKTLPINEVIEPYSDVLISIRVYRPFISSASYGPIFQEEFLVLGNQYLTELRDRISCDFNDRRIIDISANPNQYVAPPKTNPGFFFITDTFYNDTRDPKNPDYSSNIKNWLEKQIEFKSNVYKTDKMENTKFLDLNLRIGYPQVYQHNVNCEHLFCISTIQLLTEQDDLKKSNYPILKSMSIQSNHVCDMCGTMEYSYIVQDSKRQLHDNSYLCQPCFQRYHYIDGKKVGDFKAYMIHKVEIEEEESNQHLNEENLFLTILEDDANDDGEI